MDSPVRPGSIGDPTHGVKADGDKNRLDLLDVEWMEEVGQVLTFGARKYDAHNWRKGMQFSRLIAACMRHLFAFARGENNDPETGMSHLAHASCCLMFLWSHAKYRKADLDDRVTALDYVPKTEGQAC